MLLPSRSPRIRWSWYLGCHRNSGNKIRLILDTADLNDATYFVNVGTWRAMSALARHAGFGFLCSFGTHSAMSALHLTIA
ncbi:MAG: hypothetical protein K2M03_07765 [Muribaculaceae bacterium]|nr:hypothetical protein [Muribaculaceae bacterium]